MKRILALVVVVLAVLAGGQGQALAAEFEKPFEDELATLTHTANGESCLEHWNFEPGIGSVMVAKGCFTRYGDVWAVQDGFADGDQTFIYWENWLWTGSSWQPYRHGWCSNNLGAPNWGRCNKDYYESSSTNYYKGKGSKIRFQICRRDLIGTGCNPGNISNSPWIHNNG